MKSEQYTSSQKLWRIVKERGNYYVQLYLKGELIDTVLLNEEAEDYLMEKGLLK